MAEAAEQIAWTEKIIAGLREAAELEADQIRAAAHRDGALAIREVRDKIAEIVEENRETAKQRLDQAEAQAQDIVHAAEEIRTHAFVDAETIRKKAKAEASHIVATAEEVARDRDARGRRREAEAEAGARAIREQAAAELARAQRELHDLRRAAKDDELRIMSEARVQADEIRAEARHMVSEARAEVAELARRREAIAGELGNLSGVIEALAVAESGTTQSLARAGATGRGPRAEAQSDTEGDDGP
jgi:hypothetical protein